MLKKYKLKGEYAKSILPLMENTLIDIKSSQPRQIFVQNQKQDPNSLS